MGESDRSGLVGSSFECSMIPQKADKAGCVNGESLKNVIHCSVDRGGLTFDRRHDRFGIEFVQIAQERARPGNGDRIRLKRGLGGSPSC